MIVVSDTYYNLTLKMLTAFAWVDKFCPDAMFVIKADDDSYVNMDIVSSILAEVDQKNAYGGRCQTVTFLLPTHFSFLRRLMDFLHLETIFWTWFVAYISFEHHIFDIIL